MPKTNARRTGKNGKNGRHKVIPTGLAQKIVIQPGDLTEMETDAIVNAANNDLLLGSGVAGAIRRKGGDEIQRECNEIGSIPIGYAAITTGGKLKAKHVIHAASMQLGRNTTSEALRHSTEHSLRIAGERGLKTIAFPAIGTGVAGFPMKETGSSLEKIYFVLFDDEATEAFEDVFRRMQAPALASATSVN